MKILICGAGKGSWTMRGQQLGAAIGARVTSAPQYSRSTDRKKSFSTVDASD